MNEATFHSPHTTHKIGQLHNQYRKYNHYREQCVSAITLLQLAFLPQTAAVGFLPKSELFFMTTIYDTIFYFFEVKGI